MRFFELIKRINFPSMYYSFDERRKISVYLFGEYVDTGYEIGNKTGRIVFREVHSYFFIPDLVLNSFSQELLHTKASV